MRRLTLILSDLYLPEEASDTPFSQPIGMPNLDGLLRFAGARRRIGEWRTWLAEQLGETALARMPIAQACQMQFQNHEARLGWLATPVHLEARLDHVRMVDRGVLRIEPGQRAAWCDEFARVFGPQYSLIDVGERGFLLNGIAPTAAQTHDPTRVLDSDIAAALPRGPEAAELRRLGAEIEMWLHRAPLNARRERSRELRISALWLWGGGLPSPTEPAAARKPGRTAPDVHFFGGDPFLLSLAGWFADSQKCPNNLAPAPASFAALDSKVDHAVVELTPMTGPAHESLHSLDAQWFAAVRAALANGSLGTFDLVANDRCFQIPSRQGWKFWRRKVSWLEQMRSDTRRAKA